MKEDHWVTATGVQKARGDGRVWSNCPQEDVKLALPNDAGERERRDLVREMGVKANKKTRQLSPFPALPENNKQYVVKEWKCNHGTIGCLIVNYTYSHTIVNTEYLFNQIL